MTESFIKSFSHLKNLKYSDNALNMLQRIASLVKPIMKKHGWVLPCLAEFYPDQHNLLDVNGGEKILLRLRPPYNADIFLQEEEVVQTMLHELTHNVQGPHDDKFYKFLSGLQDEYDALVSSGYSGEGFFSNGQRLGTNVSHNLPPHLARAKALEAAEKRQKISGVMGGGGRRLGGSIQSNKSLSPRELAARAAERRAHDDKACGQGDFARQEAEKAAKNSVQNDVIDLTLDDSDKDDDEVEVIAFSSSSVPKKARPLSRSVEPSSKKIRTTRQEPRSSSSRSGWSCPVCTLDNQEKALQCDACLTTRPVKQSSTGWTCLTCAEAGISHDLWSCTFCGTIKATS
ncbi:hypothetical protein V5O48_009986 [Marasmius crinis-equi]|uniref:WLM-domain-containing protein n=1 Tax=Marasmius crinis-equi TaxID=585013 RepID=A0ABR3FA88_9AGAR